MTECDKEASVIVEGPFPQTGNPKIDRQLESFLQLEDGWLDGARLATGSHRLAWLEMMLKLHSRHVDPSQSLYAAAEETFRSNGQSTREESRW